MMQGWQVRTIHLAIAALFLAYPLSAFAESKPYLDQSPAYQEFLPPPPMPDTPADQRDVIVFKQMETAADEARWKMAEDDAAAYSSEDLIARFASALALPKGVTVTRQNAPHLLALLDGSEQDAQTVVGAAKAAFVRPRPYARLGLQRYCQMHLLPAGASMQKAQPPQSYSYPSGHATRGWQAALILARVAPQHAASILARGQEYGNSRVICRVHYPSDVAAGQILATVLVEREAQTETFQSDLSAAIDEYTALVK